MKKIYLTEKQLNYMIKNMIQEVDDNTPNSNQENRYSYDDYLNLLDTNYRNIQDSLTELRDLFFDVEDNENIDPEDKQDIQKQIRDVLVDEFGIHPSELEGYEEKYEEDL